MITRVRIAALLMLSAVLAGTAIARERGETPPPRATGPQEAEVLAVMLDQRTQMPTVLLQGKRDKRQVQMAIGVAEATGIAVPLQGVTPPRPLTHDLFLTMFGRLHVSLTKVVITDLRDDVYYATVYLNATGSEMTLDSRPSDAIALAIRAKVPVLVEDRVFDKASLGQAPRGPHI
jgi:bifunctional DNase/RNase